MRCSNEYHESCNEKPRDQCSAQRWFLTLAEPKLIIEHWRQDYNEHWPHSSLGNWTPTSFATRWAATAIAGPEHNDVGCGSLREQLTPGARPRAIGHNMGPQDLAWLWC